MGEKRGLNFGDCSKKVNERRRLKFEALFIHSFLGLNLLA